MFPGAPPNLVKEDPNRHDAFDPYRSASFVLQNPRPLMDNQYAVSVFKMLIAGVGGYPMGLAMAMLFPSHDINNLQGLPKNAGTMRKVAESFRLSFRQGWQSGRTFSQVGILFTASESALELATGRSNMKIAALSGCFTGAALAWGSGPGGMALGCATFTLFASAMDLAFGLHNPK